MKRAKRPPLGAIPRFIMEERRINDLKAAFVRFMDANYPIPQEFIDEYNELVNKLPKEDSNDIQSIKSYMPRVEND